MEFYEIENRTKIDWTTFSIKQIFLSSKENIVRCVFQTNVWKREKKNDTIFAVILKKTNITFLMAGSNKKNIKKIGLHSKPFYNFGLGMRM